MEGTNILEEGTPGVLSERTREIIRLLTVLGYECASCLCKIRHDTAVWSCDKCFCIFHLYCIKKWAKQDESGVGSSFRCPHCQVMQSPPLKYFCFCAKVRDPLYDPHITPHSCGQTCGKTRPFCEHPCPVQCHPGPCPECPAVVGPKACPCGSTSYTWRCGNPDPRKSCDNTCSKPLNCGIHRCERKCHWGACDPCSEKLQVSCHCQMETRDLACGASVFSCGRPCGKKLRCGVHVCDLSCHSGSCPPCNKDPSIIVTCPCGFSPLTATRKHCEDPIPTCGNVCGHVLDCQRHTCQALCHEGTCEPCKQRVLAKCVCGATQRLVSCKEQDGYYCGIVCKTTLSCGKHECRTLCCPARKQSGDVAHQCQRVCHKKLSCGHECGENCHRGMCPPCVHVVSERLFCRCGANFLMPPQPCGTLPPKCDRPCTLVPACSHPPVEHSCHYGDCPPCGFPVEKLCAGGHTIVKNVPCSAKDVFCGAKCGKPLLCGHECSRFCHAGPCVDESYHCLQPCGKLHGVCGHACKATCHPSKECPSCTESFERSCECGRQKQRVPCKKFFSYLNKRADERLDLACNADCLFEQRLQILANRGGRTTTSSPPPDVKYSLYLWEVAMRNLTWIQKIEEELDCFVTSGTSMKCLKAMPSEKRAVVHSLSQYYHISSEAVDAEPNRSCLLTRTPKTCLPTPLLSAAIADPEKHSPLTFIKRICETPGIMPTRVIVIKGKSVSVVAVSRILQEYAGTFVCETEELLPDDIKQLRVFFTHQTKQQQAYGHLRRNKPPFEFFLFSEPKEGSSNVDKSPRMPTSWVRSVWPVKKKGF